jgi:putative FmdB family regulatory protein
MALYDYKCPTCSKVETKNHSISDSPKFECEKCKVVLVKVYSAPAVSFKGGGWGSSN